MTADPMTKPTAASMTSSIADTHWQPELIRGLAERGPLPKDLSLPYLDDLKLVADDKKVAVKKTSKLREQLRLYKFVGTVAIWGFVFSLGLVHLSISIARNSILADFSAFKVLGPIVLFFMFIRQGSIWLDKKYVKNPNFSAVVFNRAEQTLSITHGWKRQKLTAPFAYVHAYIRYLSTPTGLPQPKLMLKIFDEQAPHAVRMNYFLDIGPAQTEYQLAAQWSVLCHFMDTKRDYPYNPHFWDAGLMHNYPDDFATVDTKDSSPEAEDYYNQRLMDYALDQNAMGMIGAERDAGLKGVFADNNEFRRTIQDMDIRQMEIAEQVDYLEHLLGTSFAVPPPGIWFSQKR